MSLLTVAKPNQDRSGSGLERRERLADRRAELMKSPASDLDRLRFDRDASGGTRNEEIASADR